jgi:GNAT superfamily N-acetyltransferase
MSATSFIDRSASGTFRPRPPMIQVRHIADDIGWRQARGLMLEYLAWVGLATGLDPFAVQPWLRDELRHLDSWYAPPRGMLLLASVDFQPVGVAGVEVQPEGWAELRRLYVTPGGRGHHLGERLVLDAMAAAADLGCQTLRLESLPGPMDRAIALYRRLGFRPAASIDHTNVDNVVSLECSVVSTAGPLVRSTDGQPVNAALP